MRILAGLLFSFFLFSCQPREESRQELSGQWDIQLEGTHIGGSLELPGVLPSGSGHRLILQKQFVLEEQMKEVLELWLFLGKPDIPMDVSLNGAFFYRRGQYRNGEYFVPGSFPAYFFVPRSLILEGENTLTLSIPPLPDDMQYQFIPYLGGEQEAWIQSAVIQFFNAELFLLFFGVSMVGAFYFFSLWVVNKKYPGYLFFALTSFFIGAYFFEQGSPLPLFFSNSYKPLMKSGLFFSIGTMMVFFLEYFNIHNKTWLKNLLLASFGLIGLFVALSPSPWVANLRFTLALIPLQLAILFSLYVMVRAMLEKNPDALIIFTGTLIGVALGTHDVVYQINGRIPDVWLQGIGFFALQLSLLLSLALHTLRLHTQLEDFSTKVLLQKKILAETNIAYARFVPKELLSFLGKESVVDVKLGDQVEREMTVLFSDIRNFTQLSESMTPEENFNFLNSYLKHMAPIIRERGGIVDKYIGDAIMALFPTDPLQAIKAAQDMRRQLKDYNQGREKAGYRPLDMGVGIHTGQLMLGIIGESHRLDGTVISDAVNTASRLEALTKTYGVPIITSKNTLDAHPEINENFVTRYLGSVPVKGKKDLLGLYEILDNLDPYHEAKVRNLKLFSRALKKWEKGEVMESQELWDKYKKLCPGDSVLSIYYYPDMIESLEGQKP